MGINDKKISKKKEKGIFTRLDDDTNSNLVSIQAKLLQELRDRITATEVIRRCINIVHKHVIEKNDIKLLKELMN